ncbi:MAG TPA: hypothetical protein VG992_01255 [Candidatus Saccharimonadales bacterium]|nr:hypothetical protein [Candidatus Saccharimonadales bacterium]
MLKRNQQGGTVIIVVLIFTILLLIGAASFAVWAYGGRQDYKNNVDQKIASAVAVAKQQQTSNDEQQFAQQAKYPLSTYTGPGTVGSISVKYPKTWSAYIDNNGSNSSSDNAFAAYFNPGTVPSIENQHSVFALQIQVVTDSYSQSLQDAQQNNNEETPVKIAAYSLPSLPKVVGAKLTGTLPNNSDNNQTGTMIMLPLRGQTLEITTEGNKYLSDFTDIILKNLTFSP